MCLKYLLISLVINVAYCDILDTLNVTEDGLLDFKGLSAKYGHPAEVHSVVTRDGYVLELYRLHTPLRRRRRIYPGISHRTRVRRQRQQTNIVLFLHGVFDTSDGWILRGKRSLGIMAADRGYDAWFINFRGNRYSRKHVSMDPDTDEAFWNYSAPEYAIDVQASIDYILNNTGQDYLNIFGFSEGTTATFILGSTQPEYNEKVKLFVAMAPVAYMENVRPALSTIIGLSPLIDWILPPGMQEMGGYYSFTKAFINMLCTQLSIGYELCYQGGMNSVSGKNSTGIEREFFPTIVAHFPGGTSRKNLLHFAQISLKRTFGGYDYGLSKNIKVYNSLTPPQYDLNKFAMNTVLMSGPNDIVSTAEDIARLKKQLPNVLEHKVVNKTCFNHLDFMWGRDAYELVYLDVLNTLKKFTLFNSLT